MMANSLKTHQFYRRRLPRYKFEASDRTLLQNLVNKYIGIVERKAINQNMLDEKKRAWQFITKKFNSESVDKRVRDAKQLRKCWENMKWRARREARQAHVTDGGSGELADFTHPSHLTLGLDAHGSGDAEPGGYMNGNFDGGDDDDGDEDDMDGNIEAYELDDDDEEEEVVAPMGTEPIEVCDENGHDQERGTNGKTLVAGIATPSDPRRPGGPMSHPPDDELIGSFVADSWIAEEGHMQEDDREAIHIKSEVLEIAEPIQITQSSWHGSSSVSSPTRSLGSTSANLNAHSGTAALVSTNTIHDLTPRAPSVGSSAGDAVESLSSRHSVSSMSMSRTSKRSQSNDRAIANHNHNHSQPHRVSPAASSSLLLVDGDPATASSSSVGRHRTADELDQQLQQRSEEEHARRMELLQAQVDYEQSKVERMRRLMEMSEIEHRARMRMLVRYQQVAEKQKEYWSHHVDSAKGHEIGAPDQF